MSRVRKLSICGVRNFSDSDTAEIKFSRPLTLIVGQNGVGKTTIIECLRYVTTGEYPPGVKGPGFIHDPMLKRQVSVQVRGNVKAEFVDRQSQILTVSRNMQATKYENKVTFKTLDNSVSVQKTRNSYPQQLTSRCADIDQEVMSALGVSKAILNNVIFCHQDDANWPLDENSAVKKRFDAIFETVKYNKALEFVRKLAKSKAQDLRVYQAEKITLAERVEEVATKEAKLNDFLKRKEQISRRIEEMKEQLEPIKERLREIKSIDDEFRKVKVEEEKKKVEFNLAKKQLDSLEAAVKEIYEGSDVDLEEEIASYDSTLHQKNQQISTITSQLQELTRSEEKLARLLGDHKLKMGTLQQQMRDQQARIAERNEVLKDSLKLFHLDPSVDAESEDDVLNAIESVEEKTRDFEKSINSKRMRQDQEESVLEKQVNAARDKRAKVNSELKRGEEEAEEIRSTVRNTRMQIGQADDAAKKLDVVDAKLQEMEKKIKEINDVMKSENIEEKMNQESRKLEKTEDEWSRLDAEMTIIQNQSALNVKLESLKSELKNKNKEIDKLREKHEDNIKELTGSDRVPEYNLKESIEKIQKVFLDRLEKLNKEVQSKEYELMTVEAALAHQKKELNAKITDVEYDKEKVRTYCKDYDKYEESLMHQQRQVKALQDRRGMIAHQGIAFSEYMKELTKKSCCALCERSFEKTSDAQKLERKLKGGIKDHPQLLKQCERDLKTEQEKYDTLLSLRTTVEAIVKFEEVDKEQLSKSISDKEKQVKDLQREISTLKESRAVPERKVEMIKGMIPDLTVWDRYSEDVMRINFSLDELQDEMSSTGRTTNKTMDEIQAERETLKKTIKEAREKINELRSALDARREELRRASEKRTRCLEEQLRIHNEVQKLRQLKDNLEELLTKEKTLRSSMQTLRQQLVSAEEELEQAIRELDELKSKHREEQENARKRSKEYERQWEKLNAIQGQIAHFTSLNVKTKLETLEREVREYQRSSEEKREEKLSKEKQLIQIKEDISCHETKKRNLMDNLELRKSQKSIKVLESSYRQLRSKLESLNYETVMQEQSELSRKHQVAEGEINKACGNKDEIKKNVLQLQQELNRPEYRCARDDYKEKCLRSIITQQAIEDSKMYTKVLDLAMTEYHEERMSSVNKTMQKLWGLIYTGSDTKSIQIKADAASSSGTTDRRQFNYKLVQVKHGVEMDMRGRCSAGQRVLASIILRLALAETFCEQCGILALDEPTTNLDAENAHNLADALYKYVVFRAKYQQNFQLIIITHDENFITKLSELSNQNCAYELYRNKDGLTSVRYLVPPEGNDSSIRSGSLQPKNEETQNDTETQRTTSSRKRAHTGGPSNQSKKPFQFDTNF